MTETETQQVAQEESGSEREQNQVQTPSGENNQNREDSNLVVNASELIESKLSSALKDLKSTIVSEVSQQIIETVNKQLETKFSIHADKYAPKDPEQEWLNRMVEGAIKIKDKFYEDGDREKAEQKVRETLSFSFLPAGN